GATGHPRGHESPAARALHGLCHPEPDRAGGNLSAARGPGRPVPAQGQGRIPEEGRGAADLRPDDHGRDAAGDARAESRGRAPPSHPAHLRGRGGECHHRRGGRAGPGTGRGALRRSRPGRTGPPMLDRETFSKIRRIQIRTRVILESGIGGAYHAVFKGRGMEFAEVREYQPGDDARTIDWNVTARMGAPYVKKFVEERDLTLLLAVDVSGSQSFGSQFLLKRDYAAELAAVLAF